MSMEFIAPDNYVIRVATSISDKIMIYKLIVLNRPEEVVSSSNTIFHRYSIIRVGLFALVVSIVDYMLNILILKVLFFILIFVLVLITILHLVVLDNTLLADNVIFLNKRRNIIALYQEQIIGNALIDFRENHSVLLGLYVHPVHRHRGIGSCLVQHVVQESILPIYLYAPSPELRLFYARFGFVDRHGRGYNMLLS